MLKYIKQFANHTAYNAVKSNLDKPNVSLCEQENEVHYNPFTPPYDGFCKLTLRDGSIIELEGSGELYYPIISNYKQNLVSIEIGTLCTSILENTFDSYEYLENVIIPDGITDILMSTFYNCPNLTSVTIPNSVTSIGQGAFSKCTSLTSITIPNSVTSIDATAFSNCSSLTEIISLATTAPTIVNNTFRNVKTNGTLIVPNGSSGYDTWMGTGNYYLGKYNWTKVEQ